MKTPRIFADSLADMTLKSVFNPYSDHCALHDRDDGARVRKRNLVRCLEAAIEAQVDTIWIARDLGYRGGRRTGVPLTDEVHLTSASTLLGGIALDRATRGSVVAERTAAVVWRTLSQVGAPVALWNIFPLHPHEPEEPLSNRCHTCAERNATWPFLTALIEMIAPRRIVAIGRDAGLALSGIDIPVMTVRHPSYGGQSEFIAGVHAIYGIGDEVAASQLPLLAAQDASGATA